MLDAQDALYDAIASDDTEKVQSAMQKYEDAFKTANEKIASDADASLFVQKWLEDFNAQMTSQTKDYTLQIDLEANTDNLDKRVKLAVSEFNKLGAIDDVMIKAAIDGDPASGLKKYADALNLVAESYGYTYDEFVNVLTRFGYIQGKQETIAKNAVSLEKALEPVTAAKEQLAAAEKDFQESGTSGFTDDFLASLTKDATAELSKLILQYLSLIHIFPEMQLYQRIALGNIMGVFRDGKGKKYTERQNWQWESSCFRVATKYHITYANMEI